MNGFGVGGSSAESVYNLFIMMTTANHPDTLMFEVDFVPF